MYVRITKNIELLTTFVFTVNEKPMLRGAVGAQRAVTTEGRAD